jgi:hypothetical protein
MRSFIPCYLAVGLMIFVQTPSLAREAVPQLAQSCSTSLEGTVPNRSPEPAISTPQVRGPVEPRTSGAVDQNRAEPGLSPYDPNRQPIVRPDLKRSDSAR